MAINIPILSNYEFDLSESEVEIIGNYNLIDGHVKNVGAAIIPAFKPWGGVMLNLNEGFEGSVNPYKAREGHAPLEDLRTWVKEKKFDLADNNVDFVCKRGILRNIGYAVYNTKESWDFKVCRKNGIIYLSDVKVVEEEVEEYLRKCSYWGQRFEKLMTEGHDDDIASYIVVKCKIGEYMCLVSGETDCKTEDENYVEIKTANQRFFTERMSKGWLQAYLGGNQILVYGLRDKYGYVNAVKKENVSQVPGKYQGVGNWRANSMFGFINAVLQKLKDVVPEGGTCTLKHSFGKCTVTVDSDSEVFLIDDTI